MRFVVLLHGGSGGHFCFVYLTVYVIQHARWWCLLWQSVAVAPSSSTFHQIAPPKYLDLNHSGKVAENWKLWKEKYSNYFVISRLDRKTPEFQLAMFKHTIADDALKVIKTFNYAEGRTRMIGSLSWAKCRSIASAKSAKFTNGIVSICGTSSQRSRLIVLLPSWGIWPRHVTFVIVCGIV